MSDLWLDVDRYIVDQLLPADEALAAALRRSDEAGLPAISVSPNQGKLLMFLAMLREARRILEIGTLGGYSTIWLARALPADGRLMTCEADPKHAQVAVENIERAGLGDRVEVRVGPALDTLPLIEREGHGPFDVVFIDADKPNTPHYVEWALQMSRPGTLIIVDNVVRNGAIIDAETPDPSIQAMRRVFEQFSTNPRVTATAIQTVGSKGYDGFAVAVVR